jgi:hypothetical protein
VTTCWPRILFASLCSLLALATSVYAETLVTRIAQQYLGSVVTVIAVDENGQPLSLGSGFFIDSQGTVATNAHVVEGATSVTVRWRSERRDAVRVTRFDSRYDAVLIETGFKATPSAPIGDAASMAVGEEVIVLGNPRGLEGSVSTGIVSAFREIGGAHYLQITAPISPGSSGGPVFNANGRVVGIATATVSRGQNLNFALGANVLRALPLVDLRFRAVKAPSSEESDTTRWKNLVRVTNAYEDIIRNIGWLSGVTFSIQNDARIVIRDVTVLLVIRGPDGQVLDFKLPSFADVIPPGLARQVSVNFSVRGYAEPLDREKYLSEQLGPVPRQNQNENYSEYLRRFDEYNRRRQEMASASPNYARKGSIEFRILDFKAMATESPVEQLLSPRGPKGK